MRLMLLTSYSHSRIDPIAKTETSCCETLLPSPELILQSYGPFLGTLKNRCRITIIGIQKGSILLTTTHMQPSISIIQTTVPSKGRHIPHGPGQESKASPKSSTTITGAKS